MNDASWGSYQIRILAGCASAGNAGNVFPTTDLKRKPLVSDPDMHHGTCVTHVPWCMSGSLTRSDGENVPAFPARAQPAIWRVWQEAHVWPILLYCFATCLPFPSFLFYQAITMLLQVVCGPVCWQWHFILWSDLYGWCKRMLDVIEIYVNM